MSELNDSPIVCERSIKLVVAGIFTIAIGLIFLFGCVLGFYAAIVQKEFAGGILLLALPCGLVFVWPLGMGLVALTDFVRFPAVLRIQGDTITDYRLSPCPIHHADVRSAKIRYSRSGPLSVELQVTLFKARQNAFRVGCWWLLWKRNDCLVYISLACLRVRAEDLALLITNRLQRSGVHVITANYLDKLTKSTS